MPSPQTREIFGMSAVITTISPSLKARIMARMAAAAFLADVATARGATDRPDAEMAQGDGVELAIARAGHRLSPGSSGRLAKWIMKCCPCHMAAITGIMGPIRS